MRGRERGRDAANDDAFLEGAVYGLSDRAPELSARGGLWGWQIAALTAACAAAAACVWLAPGWSFLAASLAAAAFFSAVMAFRLLLLAASLWPRRAPWRRAAPTPAIPEEALPRYSILVALNQEADVLPATVKALCALDYPPDKLDILLILEERDFATQKVAGELRLDRRFTLVTVPHCLPQTKPKACNYALNFAQGDFIAIYDAEDRPDPMQLRLALGEFAADPLLSCVQGRLAFYNASENWLTNQFAIEFSTWFELVLPGLERLGLPIPLGGTSNHFRTADLKAALGWDAFNVTEDADLGIRLKRMGARVKTMASTTLEEANCELGNWIHQRSRWLKGYLQTYLVHMREPRRLWRELGPWGFVGFQLLVGAALPAAFMHAFFWGVLAVGLVGWPAMPGVPTLTHFGNWPIAIAVAGNGLAIATGLIAALRVAARQGGGFGLVLGAFAMPVYWFLISAAAFKALFSFASRPFYWAKTRHGLTRLTLPRGE